MKGHLHRCHRRQAPGWLLLPWVVLVADTCAFILLFFNDQVNKLSRYAKKVILAQVPERERERERQEKSRSNWGFFKCKLQMHHTKILFPKLKNAKWKKFK